MSKIFILLLIWNYFLWDLNRYRQYQSTTEVRLGELQSELKLRTFEFDRLQLLYEENLKSLKTIQIESEKLQKKNEV